MFRKVNKEIDNYFKLNNKLFNKEKTENDK